MNSFQEVSCKVSRDKTLLIKTKAENISLDKEVFAVNWFVTKNKTLYNFYNLLAVKSVYNVGARPIFKGEIVKKILGSDQQNMLLIVKYPSVKSFKNLIEKLYFKLISVIRIKAVKDFNFGFTTKNNFKASKTKDTTKKYAVHHYSGEHTSATKKIVIDLASRYQVKLFYSGSVSSLVHIKNKDKNPKQISCNMDEILLWYSDSEESIMAFVENKSYKEFIAQTSNSYLGILDRSL
ncbi:hypothetical protein D1816_24685 [Aquimarina sp. AD10]|uniref:hypothetical protein n=1 Tax=Aquimarina sp. AD10 TaxID=1714849 RepID=UPI000E52BE0B|nr:hypothetical protein [Aquimarina sp. AD10]AXT63405.1 hypothetical protein D1816_24685 [Aquimarina sp. AD10]RKN00582.1 hypothetical protein D7033_07010 [Aquimarina sp. AD10]